MEPLRVLLDVALGIAAGVTVSACADRLPPRRQTPAPGARRSRRWALVVAICASLYAYLGQRWGWHAVFWMQAGYCTLLLLIAVIDLEHSIVPNVLVGAGVILVLTLSVVRGTPPLGATLGGGLVGGVAFALLGALRRGALGMGDVKLAALIGMMTGFPWVLQALVLGVVLGGVAAAVALIARLRTGKQYMPYAPYLVAGSVMTLLHGRGIADWYARLSGFGG